MEVKGTGIKTTKEFVNKNFKDQYRVWIDSLSPKSKELYTKTVEFSGWFPIQEAYIEPVDQLIKICFDGNEKKGAEELGYFSAEYALKGVYKVFLLVASPQFLMKRASKIMSTFYQPCSIKVKESGKNSVELIVSEFSAINNALEIRIAAWCKRALELANCKDVTYKIINSLSKGGTETLISFEWA